MDMAVEEGQTYDAIVALGSHDDPRVADRAAALFMLGFAPVLVCCGGQRSNSEPWTPAQLFASIARELGAPDDCIVIESESRSMVQSCKNTAKRMSDLGLSMSRILLVQKPHLERRTFVTFSNHWPGENAPIFCVTSYHINDFEEYVSEFVKGHQDFSALVNIMVGDLQRLKEYKRKDFRDEDLPVDVLEAWRSLVKMGFTKHLIPFFHVDFTSAGGALPLL